ncbi:MAG TPA: tetratricopeptide repeat protein [Acidobacteriota bacterium]|jgi:DNA-binding winged helix-turn-helix (wHTH) protein/tetratricopeptide (TPR) repeat protein/TolB-like protein
MQVGSRKLYRFGAFSIDAEKRLLIRANERVPIPPKAFDTLVVLVENSGQTLQKDYLMRAIWPDTFVEEANLTQHISLVRKILGEHPDQHHYIATLPGRGYRFVAKVEVLSENHQPGRGTNTAGSSHEGTGESQWPDRINSDQLIARRRSRIVLAEEQEIDCTDDGPASVKLQNRTFVKTARWILVALPAIAIFLVYLWISGSFSKSVPAEPIRSMAVLPLESIGSAGADEYLKLGMADALITKLGSLSQIAVRPTSAVRSYVGVATDPLTAGRKLGVDAVLDGNVQKVDDRIRVTIQLLRVSDGKSLWSEKFDEKFTHIFAVQDSISEKVARAVLSKLSGRELSQITKRFTESPESYDAYLRGRYFWNKRSVEGFAQAIENFQRAIEIDPNYAMAYAGLGESYLFSGDFTKARENIGKALCLDDALAEAHTALGFYLYAHPWDYQGAEKAFQRALALNPNYATAHHWHAYTLATLGRLDQATLEIKRAKELDPLSLIINTDVGEILYFARRYDEAEAQLQKVLSMDANFSVAHYVLGHIYLQKRKYQEAIGEYKKAIKLSPSTPSLYPLLACAYAASGSRDEAVRTIEEAKRVRKKSEENARQHNSAPAVVWFQIGTVYAVLGQDDVAFRYFEKAYEERDFSLNYFHLDPRLDVVRGDSRSAALLQKLGLDPRLAAR